MPELVVPAVHLHEAWLEAHAEWGPGLHEDGFGLSASDEVESAAGFAAWVGRLGEQPECTYRWIVEGDAVLGGIALRYGAGEFVQWAGHIGYGIRPSVRRRGLGSWALGQMLDEAWRRGLDRVLLVCEAGNVASVKTIERHGGVLESIQDTDSIRDTGGIQGTGSIQGTGRIQGTGPGPARRYWIEASAMKG